MRIRKAPKAVIQSTCGFRGTSEFSSILSEWLRVIEHYGSCWEWNDCFWWYRERPCLSIFSGAIWRLGGVVLEEFKATKQRFHKDDDEMQVGYEGRCDLSFKLQDANGIYTAYDAETKHVWCELDRDVIHAISKTKTKLSLASAEIRSLEAASQRLAVVFVSFTISKEKGQISKQKRFNVTQTRSEWMTNFAQAFDADNCSAIAWFMLDLPHHQDTPGTAIILQLIK